MEQDLKLLQNVKRLMIARYPRFAQEIAKANLQYKTDLPSHTAATDGKNIYFDPSYLASLSDDDKLFIIAHELMHIKFEHMFRMTDKNGEMRNPGVWNFATDAIINANLERDGFKIKEGYVNRPEALNYTAEEFYEKLMKEDLVRKYVYSSSGQTKKEQNGKQQNQNNQGKNSNEQNNQSGDQDNQGPDQSGDQDNQGPDQSGGQDNQGSNQFGNQNSQGPDQSGGQDNQGSNQFGNQNSQGSNQFGNQNSQVPNQFGAHESLNKQNGPQAGQDGKQQDQSGQGSKWQIMDDHSLWEEAFEESKKNTNGKKYNYSTSQEDKQSESKNIKLDINGNKIEFEDVKFDEKFEFQKNRIERREIARQRIEKMKDQELKKSETGNIEFGEVGEAKAILDWKLLLRREIEKTETIWSQRRSIAENNYAYRLEENDLDDEAQTEVMIDVSGSVSLEMIKAFLRQLKPILKASKLKVGCFNEKYWGMVEIKSNRDIDNFKIPRAARGDPAWTENWDLAVRSFTKKSEINKIVFTDGEPCPGTMPKEDLKGTNVIWLVYSNRNFNPCCGKVIQISKRDLQNLSLKSKVKTKDENKQADSTIKELEQNFESEL